MQHYQSLTSFGAALLVLAAGQISFCGAQELFKGSDPVRGLLELVKVQGVYEDLQIVDFQDDKIRKALADMQTANRELAGSLRGASPEEQQQVLANFKVAKAKAEAEIGAILLPAQVERLRQIRLNIVARNDGATVGLKNREFLEHLDLTDPQKAEIEKKAAEVNKVIAEKVRKLRAEIEKVRLEGRDDLIKVLTPDQRKKYLELVGRPFEGDQPK